MQVRIRKTSDVYCVELIGKVSYDTLDGFHQLCKEELLGQKVVFNCQNLDFVGSIGITDFLVQIAGLQKNQTQMKFVDLAQEFIKLISKLPITKGVVVENYHSDFDALKSYQQKESVTEEVLRSEIEGIQDLS